MVINLPRLDEYVEIDGQTYDVIEIMVVSHRFNCPGAGASVTYTFPIIPPTSNLILNPIRIRAVAISTDSIYPTDADYVKVEIKNNSIEQNFVLAHEIRTNIFNANHKYFVPFLSGNYNIIVTTTQACIVIVTWKYEILLTKELQEGG